MFLTIINEGVTVFHMAVNFKGIEVFQGIFNLAKENQTKEEVKSLLLATVNKKWTVFHLAPNFKGIELFQGIFNWAKENLTIWEIK
jgi:endo-1,4-beta-D-glucanase Y